MDQNSKSQRLGEILIKEGLISEAEIKEALLRQKAHGGKFGSQLLYHRYIDEPTLVKALEIQFGTEGVVLSGLEIDEMLITMIPKRVALTRKVIPFNYDPENNILKIACENPIDQSLLNELNFVTRGKDIKLCIAAELSLNTAIARYYLGHDISLDDNLLLEIPDIATDTGKIKIEDSTAGADKPSDDRPAILLVTDEAFAAPMLQSLLERDNYRVVLTDSADDAIDMLGDQKFHTVFIKDTITGDYIDLIERVRKISPRTTVRYYESVSALLLSKDAGQTEAELLRKNLELFTTLLSSKLQHVDNHGGRVGRYADRLCGELGLPNKDRIMITNAAYIHDLAKYYYSTEETRDIREVIKLTVKLLTSLNYSPVLQEMLRCMYIDLKHKYTKRLPIEVLGGNIMTIVDLFCETIPRHDRLSLDKFDAVKKKLRDLVGKLFLGEVVEAFINMIQEEILDLQTSQTEGQVMIYAGDTPLKQPLEMRMKNEGFRTVAHTLISSFLELYRRSEPDLMILVIPGEPEAVFEFMEQFTEAGVKFESIPTFLLADGKSIPSLTGLLERGIEDIVAMDDNLDMLITKIRKLRAKIKAKAEASEKADSASGARGRLADMNLIDLLQALGPSRKTVKMTVKSNDREQPELIIYLDRGQIIFAEMGSLIGAEAVYKGITWFDGAWVLEPMESENLPEPNNNQLNESIMIEGCRLMDEKIRAGQLL